MTNSINKSCAVAVPIERNCATFTQKDATLPATTTQLTPLKALAGRILERNRSRNIAATDTKTDRNFSAKNTLEKLRNSNNPTPKKYGTTSTGNKPITPEKWISEKIDLLKKAGFTERDLYNKLWPKGIALLPQWNHPGLQVKLNGKIIFFTWRNATGRQITQTCRPEKQPSTRVLI